MKDRVEVFYSGRVQGVGFRYTVERIAAGLAVNGFVCNLPDGRVHLVAEGVAEELDRLLERVAAVMQGNISATEKQSATATGEYSGFQILVRSSATGRP